jgi:membrane-associated phospholipid phosphatase
VKALVKVFDLHLTQLILLLPESWRGLFVIITSLGDPIVIVGIGVAAVLYGVWSHNVKFIVSGSFVGLTLIVGSILKLLFGRERPMTEYAENLRIDTYSFPSGHSSGAMIAYGLLAYIAMKTLPQPYGLIAAIACGVIVLLVGISRIYLGAHFPSDVLAGWILGAIMLIIVIVVVRPLL